MKRAFLVLGTAVVILPSLAGARVQADLIQWTASASVLGGSNIPAQSGTPFGPTGGIWLSSGGNASGKNSGTVLLAQLSAYTTDYGQESNEAGDFSGPSAHYQLSLLLRDQASGASRALTFRGFFGGEIAAEGTGSDTLTNTFVGPTTQTLKLGQNLYTVALGPVILPTNTLSQDDNPNATSGSIRATISVQPLTNSTPEPSSLVLACLGLPSLGLAGWFRRRRRKGGANVVW